VQSCFVFERLAFGRPYHQLLTRGRTRDVAVVLELASGLGLSIVPGSQIAKKSRVLAPARPNRPDRCPPRWGDPRLIINWRPKRRMASA
jgi:hypothetical protein